MWHVISDTYDIPFGRELRLAVIKGDEVHALVFPCRKAPDGWVHALNGRAVEVYPTHWQHWDDDPEQRATLH